MHCQDSRNCFMLGSSMGISLSFAPFVTAILMLESGTLQLLQVLYDVSYECNIRSICLSTNSHCSLSHSSQRSDLHDFGLF